MPSSTPAAPASGAAPFVRYWLPVLAYIGLIFAFSSLRNTGPTLWRWQDKVEHFLEYGLFGLLLGRAFRFTTGGRRGFAWALGAVAAGSLVGALDEIYQRSVPGRISDVRDWATDTAALIVVVAAQLVSTRRLGARRGGSSGAETGVEGTAR